MATAFDTFNQYADQAYPGQIADLGMADIVTRVASGSDIGYGLGAIDNGEGSAALPTGSEVSNGITVRESMRDNNASDEAIYPQDHEMSVMRVGRIFITTVDGAAVGDSVYVVPSSGAITNTDDTGTNIQLPNAAFKSAASAGGIALVQLDGNQ